MCSNCGNNDHESKNCIREKQSDNTLLLIHRIAMLLNCEDVEVDVLAVNSDNGKPEHVLLMGKNWNLEYVFANPAGEWKALT